MAAKISAKHALWHRIAGAERIPRLCLRRSESGADWRNFSFAGYAQRSLSRGDAYNAAHFFGRYAGIRRLHSLCRTQQPSVEPRARFDFLRRAAIRAACLGRSQSFSELGMDADAHLENSI